MLTSLVRQSLRRPIRIQQSYIHCSSVISNQATAAATATATDDTATATADTTANTEGSTPVAPRKPSSVPAGVTLKGINFLKGGKDPIALEDNEYPMWLWDLLDEKKQKQKTTKPANRQYHRKINREAIKSANFMKDKKT